MHLLLLLLAQGLTLVHLLALRNNWDSLTGKVLVKYMLSILVEMTVSLDCVGDWELTKLRVESVF